MRKNSAAALAAVAVAITGGTAFAMSDDAAEAAPEPAPCGIGDFNITTRETPGQQDRIVEIDLIAKPGKSCTLNGTLRELTFHTPTGETIVVPVQHESGHTAPVPVDETHPAFVYLTLPRTEAPQTATSASFMLPIDGVDTPVTIPWSRGVDGPVVISPVG